MRHEFKEDTYVCESGEQCKRPGEEIVVVTQRGIVVGPTEFGLTFTPTGVRHKGCPDPYLAVVTPEMSDDEAREAMSVEFQRRMAAMKS
jgi:hypothetical protein